MRIVIVGAGYAGLTTALRLARAALPSRIIVVNDRPEHLLMTQLHKVAAGAAPPDMVTLSLERLFRGTGVELVVGKVAALEPDRRRIVLEGGDVVAFDRLVVALGSEVETFAVPGVVEHAFHVQPLAEAVRLREHTRNVLHRAATDGNRAVHVAIVGGGLTGVELAGELADTLPSAARDVGIAPDRILITLMEAGPKLLPGLPEFLSAEAEALLAGKGVDVRPNTAIRAVTEEGVLVGGAVAEPASQHRLKADVVVWTAGVRGHKLTETAFRSGTRGRALVDEYLRAVDYPNVYILGDNALAVPQGTDVAVAPTAQNAVQQALVAADNIAAELRVSDACRGPALTPYTAKPLGLFVSVGTGQAVGELVFGDFWRPRLSGASAYAMKWASEQRYKLGIGAHRM